MRFFFTVFFVGLLGVAGTAGLIWHAWTMPGPTAADGTSATAVQIKPGMTVHDIGNALQKAGVVHDARIFKLMARLTGVGGKLKAGEYAIPSGASVKELVEVLVEGKSIEYELTIPEGWSSVMVAELVNKDVVLVGDPIATPAEGSLLPETYRFTRGTTRAEIVQRMQRERNEILQVLWAQRAKELPYATPEEAVILASIVEKETGVPEERARIASVFLNRLRLKMRLQSDPTIIYGITGGLPLGRGIRQSELDRQTAYNTYQIDGLPPTPIANPGRDALRAVFYPMQTADLYFVADGTGGHAFAATVEEHNRNVARWRKIERERAAAATE